MDFSISYFAFIIFLLVITSHWDAQRWRQIAGKVQKVVYIFLNVNALNIHDISRKNGNWAWSLGWDQVCMKERGEVVSINLMRVLTRLLSRDYICTAANVCLDEMCLLWGTFWQFLPFLVQFLASSTLSQVESALALFTFSYPHKMKQNLLQKTLLFFLSQSYKVQSIINWRQDLFCFN